MTRYFLDTNAYLRFFLKDNLRQYRLVIKNFNDAKSRKIELVLIPEIIIEIEHVLNKIYNLPKNEIVVKLGQMLNMSFIDIYNRSNLQQAIILYNRMNIDLIDAYLYYCSKSENASVFSFDKDFQKIS